MLVAAPFAMAKPTAAIAKLATIRWLRGRGSCESPPGQTCVVWSGVFWSSTVTGGRTSPPGSSNRPLWY